MTNYIWMDNRRYYYYDTYNSWRQAYNIGRYHKRRNGSKYWIMVVEKGGFLNPSAKKYRLYMTKVMKIV